MAITRDMVATLLRYKPKNLVEFRNKLLVCTLTVGCMRPAEGAAATSHVIERVFESGIPVVQVVQRAQGVRCQSFKKLHHPGDRWRSGGVGKVCTGHRVARRIREK
jgi:hypothetical protein